MRKCFQIVSTYWLWEVRFVWIKNKNIIRLDSKLYQCHLRLGLEGDKVLQSQRKKGAVNVDICYSDVPWPQWHVKKQIMYSGLSSICLYSWLAGIALHIWSPVNKYLCGAVIVKHVAFSLNLHQHSLTFAYVSPSSSPKTQNGHLISEMKGKMHDDAIWPQSDRGWGPTV